MEKKKSAEISSGLLLGAIVLIISVFSAGAIVKLFADVGNDHVAKVATLVAEITASPQQPATYTPSTIPTSTLTPTAAPSETPYPKYVVVPDRYEVKVHYLLQTGEYSLVVRNLGEIEPGTARLEMFPSWDEDKSILEISFENFTFSGNINVGHRGAPFVAFGFSSEGVMLMLMPGATVESSQPIQ
ncbi:hypothetical protein A2801_01025 [Candidatus Woesebacteria bacterium RIFCSPHIGHO2_01_FULL_41_10]|uniref:Uncharacterized protein n=1 Tax=Candidatus Woesebacteria bacterium RIFCSPHIGHO2_01_FULL_41_10 TaxID=1802500 RepID=A0A1F7YNK9_9BACT|nr:MAG: hypothetical protein A2801_01025 [Candidatus Woesebacteria bacterium RIFCSPHIGHO2_01_FULL_41_10]